jgi:hypothetical protein
MESASHPGWRFRRFQPEPGFVGAIAIEGPPERIELHRWTPEAATQSAGGTAWTGS